MSGRSMLLQLGRTYASVVCLTEPQIEALCAVAAAARLSVVRDERFRARVGRGTVASDPGAITVGSRAISSLTGAGLVKNEVRWIDNTRCFWHSTLTAKGRKAVALPEVAPRVAAVYDRLVAFGAT